MIAYLDCSTGISGDKFLGALLDAGSGDGRFTPEHLTDIVAALAPEASVLVERVGSHGVSAIGVHVTAVEQPHSRSWAEIRELIFSCGLPGPVIAQALLAFSLLAEAEATVHGTPVDDVHFHEVGAVDSIVDIVGVCAGLHALGVTSLLCTPVAVGSGTVETSHGTLPVPAPATAILIAGMPITGGPGTGELTTPTGAALLSACVTEFADLPPMRIAGIGYGAGTRDIGIPNVCRILLAEESEAAAEANAETGLLESEQVTIVESNLDHLSAEELAFACEELLAQGAMDVWQTPVVMKKGRAAVMLSVLVEPSQAAEFAARVSELTGSLGVRVTVTERYIAPREIVDVATEWGLARVKVGAGRIRAEHDDVARIARETGLPYGDVARSIERSARER